MQKLILILALALTTTLCFAQNCDDPLCQQIMSIKMENQQLIATINAKDNAIKALTDEYNKLINSGRKEKSDMHDLEQQISVLNEDKRKSTSEKQENDNKYIQAIQQLKSQIVLNEAQKMVIREYEKEIKKMAATNVDIEMKKDAAIKEAKEITYENSYFFSVEVGYNKSNLPYFTKVVKDGEDFPVDPRVLGSDRLDIIRISGQTYIPVDSISNIDNLKGKLLVYSNNELLDVIDYSFTETNTKTFFNHFEINNKIFKLKRQFPENTNLKVAFVEDDLYKRNYPDIFNNFWIAQNKGVFSITSLKPQSKIDVLNINTILESSVIQGTPIRTSNPSIRVRVFDNGNEDGDRASFYLGIRKIFDNLSVKKKADTLDIPLNKGINKFTLLALSEGEDPPCTVTVEFYDTENSNFIDRIFLQAKLGTAASIQIIVE